MRNRAAWGFFIVLAAAAACSDEGKQVSNVTENDGGSSSHTSTTSGQGGEPSGPADSGVRLCSTAEDCEAGLSCEHSTLGSSGICVSDCTGNDDCDAGHACVDGTSVGFDPSCLVACNADNDCSGGMICIEIDDNLDVCLPGDWVSSGPTKGIGDACSTDSECFSGWCAGWCTKPCNYSTDCDGAYGGDNEFGNPNWCITTVNGDDICFPGCYGNSVCTNYGDTSCQPTETTLGTDVDVCSA